MARLTDVISAEAILAAFVAAHDAQDAARLRAVTQRNEKQARRRRPMANTIDGLGEQIAAARAAARHVQDKTLRERRRNADVEALRAEAVQERRQRTGY